MSIQGFVRAHRKLVLFQGLNKLGQAVTRAQAQRPRAPEESDRDAARALRFLYLQDLLAGVVLPSAWSLLASRLYSSAELGQLVCLFRPKAHRLSGAQDGRLHKAATEALRDSSNEARALVSARLSSRHTHPWFSDSLHPRFAAPLLNHLMRETILWAYALSRLPGPEHRAQAWLEQSDGLPPRQACEADRMDWLGREPMGIDAGWEPALQAMLWALEQDLELRTPHISYIEGDSAASAALASEQPPAPADGRSSHYDDDIARHLRRFLDWMARTTHDARQAFDEQLLLCFAVSGCSQLYALPRGKAPECRARIAAFLVHEKGLRRRQDEDTGDALHWWRQLRDRSRLFGSEFDKVFEAVRERWEQEHQDQAKPPAWQRPLQDFVDICVELAAQAPKAHLARTWMRHSAALSPRDHKALGRLQEPAIRQAFVCALEADAREICAGGAVLLSELKPDDQARWSLLAELRETLEAPDGLGMAPPSIGLRIQKYFTSRWSAHRERAQPPGSATLSNRDWMAATWRLHQMPLAEGFPRHWRNLWTRIQARWWRDLMPPRKRGKAVANLERLAGHLALAERLPDPPNQHQAPLDTGRDRNWETV